MNYSDLEKKAGQAEVVNKKILDKYKGLAKYIDIVDKD